MKIPIYLDYNATTPTDPRVVEAMLPYFTEIYGNAASRNHSFGWTAEKAVGKARDLVGEAIGATGKEIVFTSGATESDNMAILGAAEFYREKGRHIITSPIEHKAVVDPYHALEQKGYEITFLDVDEYGRIDLKQLESSIRKDTVLVSLMAGNNEIGTLNPLGEIGQITRDHGVLFHCDATQGVGKIPIDVDEMNIDLLSMTAHKIYGPKGIGALTHGGRNPVSASARSCSAADMSVGLDPALSTSRELSGSEKPLIWRWRKWHLNRSVRSVYASRCTSGSPMNSTTSFSTAIPPNACPTISTSVSAMLRVKA